MHRTEFHPSIDGQIVIPPPHVKSGDFGAEHETTKPKPKPFSTVPFARDFDFVDRPDILAWIHENCAEPAGRAALVGLGGVGKSQLAIEYSYQVRNASPQTWVFWVYGGNEARFEEAYRSIADRLELLGRYDPKVSVLQLVHNWLCDEANGRWIMILDNVDDVEVFYPQSDRGPSSPLAAFLPQSQNGSILITSRSRDAAAKLTGSYERVREVRAMDTNQALKLLKNKLENSFDKNGAADLLDALDHLPLAITQAAAYINRRAPRMTLSSYLDKFRKNEEKKAHFLNKGAVDLRRDPSASNSVIATWQISFEHIHEERYSAADFLSLMSFFNPQGIPEWVLRCCARNLAEGDRQVNVDGDNRNDDSEFHDDLDTLRAYSMIATTTESEMWDMHPLVQLCVRVWLSSLGNIEIWRQRFCILMSSEFPTGKFENWSKCQQLLPHIEPLFTYEPADTRILKKWARMLTNAAQYMSMKGSYKTAEDTVRKAIRTGERILGREDSDTLSSVYILASVLQSQGKYEEAEHMHRRALEGREKTLGREHMDTLASVDSLALVLRDQGKYEEAEHIHQRALEGREKALGREHPDTLTSVNNLAFVLGSRGKYKEAELMNRRALEGYEKALGKEHPDTLMSVTTLGSVLQYQGDYEQAEKINRRALKGNEKTLGKEHPTTLSSMGCLASTYRNQGRWKEAERLEVQVMETTKRVLGTEHPSTLSSMSNLASTYRNQGRWKEAERLEVQVMETTKRVLGTEHPSTLSSMSNLASTYRNQGRWKEAERLEVQVMETTKRVLGTEHPFALTSMANLALTYQIQGRWKEAEELEEEVMNTRKRVLGEEHPDTLFVMSDLLTSYLHNDRLQESRYLALRAAEAYNRKLGPQHPDTLRCATRISEVWIALGALEKAEDVLLNVLDSQQKLHSTSHPDLIRSVESMIYILRNRSMLSKEDQQRQRDQYVAILLLAAGFGHQELVELVLEKRLNWEIRGNVYRNALANAAEAGHKAVVKLLLQHGADVNAHGGQYGSALQAASAGGHEAVVKLLLQHGADVNAHGGQYGSALQAASAGGHEAVVKLLLQHGADVNAHGGQYGSALQAASAGGHEAVVKLLLKHGADVNAHGGQYGSALQAALINDHQRVVRVLVDWRTHVPFFLTIPLDDQDHDVLSAASPKPDSESDSEPSTSTKSSKQIRPTSSQTSIDAQIPEDVYALLMLEVLLHPRLRELSEQILAAKGSSTLNRILERAIRNFSHGLAAEDPDEIQRRTIRLLDRQRRYFAVRVTGYLDPTILARGTDFRTLASQIPNIHETVQDYLQSIPRDNLSSQRERSRVSEAEASPEGDFTANAEDSGDESISEDELEVEVEEPLPSLPKATVSWLTESIAFCNFIHDLTREVTSPMEYVDEVLCSGLSTFSRTSLTIHVEWDVEKYAKSQIDNIQQLPTVLTVSGSAIDAEAVTCHEYCARTWPEDGPSILEALQKAITTNQRYCDLPSGTSISFQIESETNFPPRSARIGLIGRREHLIKVTQQLAWFSVAFRSFKRRGVALSTFAIYRKTPPNTFKLKVLKLEQVNERSRSCWHPLFQGGVIASGFPIRGRNGESGIELPLEAMIELADLIGPVSYEGGIVLKGFSLIIFPITAPRLSAKEGNTSIQWHLIHTLNHCPANLSLLNNFENRWLCQPTELNLLAQARTFLGCYKKIHVHLATKEVAYDIIQQSATIPSKPKAEFTGFSTGLGFSKLLGINASAAFTIPKDIRVQRSSDSYDQMLSFSSNMPVILYDTFDQRAWMVPALGVIYHMVHVWFSQHKDNFTTSINQPPYARAVANIGKEARDIISQYGEFSLYHSVEDKKPRLLREHVKNYWLQFEQLMAVPPVHNSIGADKLTGWDLMEIVWGQPLSALSTPVGAKFQGNWHSLTQNSNMIVLFCHGLGDVIVPESETQRVCTAWKAVPPGMDYLTATVRCLQRCSTYFPHSSGFSSLMSRHHRLPRELDTIFADCSHEDEAKCHRAQQLWKRDEASLTFRDLEPEGAVIFGNQDKK